MQKSGLTEITPLICTSAMGAKILWFLILSLLNVHSGGWGLGGGTAPWVPSRLTLRMAIMWWLVGPVYWCGRQCFFTDTPFKPQLRPLQNVNKKSTFLLGLGWGWMGHTCEYLEKGPSQRVSVTVSKCPVSEGVTCSSTRLQSLGIFQTAIWLILQVIVPFPRRKKNNNMLKTRSIILFTKFQNIILSELHILFFNLPNMPRR